MNTIRVGAGVAMICSLFVLPFNVSAGYTFPTCQQAWADSEARHSCVSIRSGSVVIPEASESGHRKCVIKVKCQQNSGYFSPQDDVTVDVNEVRDLNNCNGHLKVGSC